MKAISILIGVAVCAVFGAIVCSIGASITGLPPARSGSFNLEPLVYVGLGLVTGPLAFLGSLAILRRTEFGGKLGISMICSIGLSFLSGVIGYPISKWDAKRNAVRAQERWREERHRYDDYYAAIRADPGIVVSQQWYLKWSPQWDAYYASLTDPQIRYTPEMLTAIYQGRVYSEHVLPLLRHPAFDPQLLEREYRRFLKHARFGNDLDLLGAVLSSPQARSDWFVEVESSGILQRDEPYARHLRNVVRERLMQNINSDKTPDEVSLPEAHPSKKD